MFSILLPFALLEGSVVKVEIHLCLFPGSSASRTQLWSPPGGMSIHWRQAGFSVQSQDQSVCPQMGCMGFLACPCAILALLRVSRSLHLHADSSFGVFSSLLLAVPPPGLLVSQTSSKRMSLMMEKPCS